MTTPAQIAAASSDPVLAGRLTSRIEVDAETGCWLWQGAVSDTGYGHVSVRGRVQKSHRAFYELFEGPIPAGLSIDHLCYRRICCNPRHLEPVTRAENNRRMFRDKGHPRANTGGRCRNGHEITPENSYYSKDGRRTSCRPCHLPVQARYDAIRRAR